MPELAGLGSILVACHAGVAAMTLSPFIPPADPFGRTASLDFTREVPVLGVPLRFRSNAARVIALAEGDFGCWSSLSPSMRGAGPAATFDIVVHPRTSEVLAPLAYRRHGPVFMAASAAAMLSVLLDAGQAVAFVPAQALEDEEWLRYHILGFAWMLASRSRRVPLHAAVVVGASRTLLLLAASGGGKSTLAYACGRAGLRVLTEDTVFVDVPGEGDVDPVRLWGALSCHWLAPATTDLFGELRDVPVVLRGNGKRRLQVPPIDGTPLLATTTPVTVVAIEPDGDEPALDRVEGAELAAAVAADRTQGFDQYPESRPRVIEWLHTRPAYRCRRGPDPRATAALLAALAATPPSETPASLRLPLATSLP